MSDDLDLIINNDKALPQIYSRIEFWQKSFSKFFLDNEEFANSYRLLDTAPAGTRPNQMSKTRVGETLRATEALTTSIYRMITANDPFYDLISLDHAQTEDDLYRAHVLMRYQDYVTKYKRRLMRAVRSTTLFGTCMVETPYQQKFAGKNLLWESLGFHPRSLMQCPFDPSVFEIEESPWIAFLDYMTEDQLFELARRDKENWNPEQIQKAVDGAKTSSRSTFSLQTRRQTAGYSEIPLYEVCTYYGNLTDAQREDEKLWRIVVINESVPISAGPNPTPNDDLPRVVGRFIDFELEPFGYGVGRLGRLAQRSMDSNRNAYMDLIIMGTYNMWLRDRMSGIRNTDFKIKPLGIIDADNVNGLTPLRPEVAFAREAMNLEAVYRAEHQGNTGATPNLQASVTDSSATESSIAQNEAIRRVSVLAEDMAESYVRDYQDAKHVYNREWLQKDDWLAVPGMKQPVKVNRWNIAKKIATVVKVTTDKDYRPKRMEYLKDFIQVATSIRNILPTNIDIVPIFEEYARALDIDPARIVKPEPIPSAQDLVMQRLQKAQSLSQELGPEVVAGGNGGAPTIPGGGATLTPVGPTLVTP